MRHQHADHGHGHGGAVAEVALDFCYCGTELAAVERIATGLPGVRSATADRTRAVLHLAYDPSRTSPAALREALDNGGTAATACNAPRPAASPATPPQAHPTRPPPTRTTPATPPRLSPRPLPQSTACTASPPRMTTPPHMTSTAHMTNTPGTVPAWSRRCCAGS
ncbi:hypothetical protein ACFQY4_17370 [Catellatospora bangladeshensis]|uniref:hypothetical protein n=1 Tax=Catellatospora bangladeshensis TaxID=310355 RepID=UPI00361731BE